MKNQSIVGSMLLILLLCMTGCKRPLPEHGEPCKNSVRVIKLKKPEYKNFVIACANEDGEYASNTYCCNFLGDGRLPYWELDDDYLLIDWRWHIFPLPFYSYAVCLLSEPWSSKKGYAYDEDPLWLLDTCQYVPIPIAEDIQVDMAKVNEYLGTKELYEHEYQESYDIHNKNNADIEKCRSQVGHMDSVWAYTQKQLNAIIKDISLEQMLVADIY